MNTSCVVVITDGKVGIGKATTATFAKTDDLVVIVRRNASFITSEVLKINGGWHFGF